MKLPDGPIKREIAFYNISGSFQTELDSFPITKIDEIPILYYSDTSATFSNDSITIIITSDNYDLSDIHKLGYLDKNSKILICIDNKPFWGTDGGLPKEKISSVVLQIGKNNIAVPDTAINDLFQPNFCYYDSLQNKVRCNCRVFQSIDKKRIYIYMVNGDGAGGYEVTWVIQDKYLTRIVDYGF